MISDIEVVAVLLLRFTGVGMVSLSLFQSTGNILSTWRTIHPAFIWHYIRSQTLRSTILLLAGVALIAFAGPIGGLITSDLVPLPS